MVYDEKDDIIDENLGEDEFVFRSTNPATGECLWEGQESSTQDVIQAINSAQKAFKDWATSTIEHRISILESYNALLEKESEPLANLISEETGKPLWESKTEVSAMINKLPISIQAYEDRCSSLEKEFGKKRSITRHKPIGVLAVIGPFNFPGHLPNGHIIPALLAGNTIVFKSSELTPVVGEFIVNLFYEAGLPPGVITLVQGGEYPSITLVSHPEIDGVLFTGSARVGHELSRLMARTPQKILALEMGGNNPLIVTNCKDVEAAAYTTIQSAYITSGQRCTCARRLIIPEGKEGDRFLEALVEMIKTIKVGAYTESPEPFMGPVISNDAAQMIMAFQTYLSNRGAKPLVEMNRKDVTLPFVSPGLWDISSFSVREDEECFGPLLQFSRVPDFTAAITEANRTDYGLSAGLLSDRKEDYDLFLRESRAGIVNWNTATTGASSAAPFGGVGKSGNFRPSAYYAADYCSFPVASMELDKVSLPDTLAPGLGS